MLKRCQKGKSCGASCINRMKVCQLELGDSIPSSLGKVRGLIGRVTGKIKEVSSKVIRKLQPRPTLKQIYAQKGFNAKPEIVTNRDELIKRKDIVTKPGGEPLILYRGVTSEKFAEQFKGNGKGGDVHFPGKGIYGNGTYAAASSFVNKDRSNSGVVTAMSYSMSKKESQSDSVNPRDYASRVTAIAIRKGSNIDTSYSGPYNKGEASSQFKEWSAGIIKRARDTTGIKFEDLGEAAAALGIDAYRVPISKSEDYWVILNRGALIVAQDSQL